MLPDARSESNDFTNWAWPMVLSCVKGCCYGILTATVWELLFRVGLLDPEAKFIVDFLIKSAVVGVIGTASVCVIDLWIRESLRSDSDS